MIYICNAVAFEDFCAGDDLETVGAVGESGAVEAVVWVTFDGFLCGGEGYFAVVIPEYQRMRPSIPRVIL